MRIIAVDDEKLALQSVLAMLKELLPDAEVPGFRTGAEARDYAKENEIDIALLDIEMRDMNGVDLARELKLMHPNINIIFTTGYSEYIAEAMALHASGYLLKPITADRLKAELEDLRRPVAAAAPLPTLVNAIKSTQSSDRLTAKTFGSFELYHEDKPVDFRYAKSKELIAYLIDRNGALITNNEAMDILWEDDDPDQHKSYLKNLKRDIKESFEKLGVSEIFIQQWGRVGIMADRIDCDYFDWLVGKPSGINAYHGEYMLQYSWAEFTTGRLDQEIYKY